jgi:predicted ATP-dependent serine protease
MVCYQCGFETEMEAGRCPSCGGFLRKEDEERRFAEIDDEIEHERGFPEYQRPFECQNKCEWCGVENHTMRDDKEIILTIAHLDHTPENCARENLRALCQKCHNGYDARQ